MVAMGSLRPPLWAGQGRRVERRTFPDVVDGEDVEGGQPAIARCSNTDSALWRSDPAEYEPEPCGPTATMPTEASPRNGSDVDETGSPLGSPGIDHAAACPAEGGSGNDKFADREEAKEADAADMRTTLIPKLRNLPNNFTRQMPPQPCAGQGRLLVRNSFLHWVDSEEIEGGRRPAIAGRSKTDSALWCGAPAEYEPEPCSTTATTPTEASPRGGSDAEYEPEPCSPTATTPTEVDVDETGSPRGSPGIEDAAAFPAEEGSSNDKFADREEAKEELGAADMRTTLIPMMRALPNNFTWQMPLLWPGEGTLVVKNTFLDFEGGPQPKIARHSKTDSVLWRGSPAEFEPEPCSTTATTPTQASPRGGSDAEYEPEPCSTTATTPTQASPRGGSDADETGSPWGSPGIDRAAAFPAAEGSSNDIFADREEAKEEVDAADMRTTLIPMKRNSPNNFTRQMPPQPWAGQGRLVVRNSFLDWVDGETDSALWRGAPAEYEPEPCSSTATTSTESSPRQGNDLDESGIDHVAAFPAEDVNGTDMRTTLMLRNLPNNYTRQMLLDMLDQAGFASNYDFVYLPHDFKRGCGLGYAFVNLVSPGLVPRFREAFEGYREWAIPSAKVCQVGWSTNQGWNKNVNRYRKSPVMHASVRDEYKPCVFEGGQPVPFPTSGRRVCRPQGRT